jgi:uncharacterized protein (TIGR03435 family)
MSLTRGLAPILVAAFSVVVSGADAPALHATKWLQAPEGFDGQWSKLRGKVVVLEFWATWCAPCIEAIPHLNELSNEFKGQDVVFLAITDDEVDRLGSFLSKVPIQAIIGIDSERLNWDAFGIPSIPHTVLIGRDGGVIGSTLPGNITPTVLREALAGGKPTLAPKEGIASDLSWDEHSIEWQDGVIPAMYAIIKPIQTTTSGAWPRPGHITADGVPLQSLVQLAYQTDNYHIDWRMPRDEQLYRAAFRVREEQKDRLLPLMQHTLADLFGIETRWETQERKVLVLHRIEGEGALPESKSEKESAQMWRGRITLHRQPAGKLCMFLGDVSQSAVVDETGLTGRYDFDVPYQHGQPEVTSQALKAIGLELVGANRKVKVLVVAPQ